MVSFAGHFRSELRIPSARWWQAFRHFVWLEYLYEDQGLNKRLISELLSQYKKKRNTNNYDWETRVIARFKSVKRIGKDYPGSLYLYHHPLFQLLQYDTSRKLSSNKINLILETLIRHVNTYEPESEMKTLDEICELNEAEGLTALLGLLRLNIIKNNDLKIIEFTNKLLLCVVNLNEYDPFFYYQRVLIGFFRFTLLKCPATEQIANGINFKYQ